MPSLSDITAATTVDISFKTSGEAAATSALKNVKEAYEGVAVASDNVEKKTLSVERRLESIQRRYDAEYRSAKTLAAVRRDLDLSMKEGLVSIERASQLYANAEAKLKGLATANDNLVHASGRAAKSISPEYRRMLMQDLAFQGKDFFEQVISGSSPFRAALTQGPQAAAIMKMGGFGIGDVFKSATDSVGGLLAKLGPLGIAFGGVAAGAAFATLALNRAADQENEIARALRVGAGLRSGLAAGDIEALSHVPGLSRSEGRASALAYGGAGASRANTAAALGLTHGLADLMYEGDVKGAQKGLSDAMRGGTASLLRYVDGIRPLSTATSDWIERIQAMQGEQAANAELLRILNDGIRAAGIEVPLWRQALTKLGNTASDLADDFLKEAGKRANATVQEAQGIGRFLSQWGAPREDSRARPPVDESRYGRPLTPLGGTRASDPFNLPLPPDVGNAGALIEAEIARGIAGAKQVRGLNGVYDTDAEALRKLNDDLATYDRLLRDSAVASQMSKAELEAARLGHDRLAAAVTNFMTVERQAAQAFELSRQSIGAYTADQKLAAIQAQRFAEVSRDKTRAHLAEAEAQRAVTLETERWKATAEQSLRAAQDQLKTAGMLPWQKQMADLAIERDRNIQQFKNPDLYNAIYDAKASALRITNSDNVQRDYRMHLGEMGRSYAFQRDSFGQPDQVVETMRAKTEMLNEAMRNGQSAAERYGAGWENLAAQMGHAKAATDDLARAQQDVIAGMDEMRAGSRGALTGVFSDLRQGKDPRQNILSSLGRMQDQMFDRTVSRPAIEALMGRDSTGQSGLVGQGLAGIGSLFGLDTVAGKALDKVGLPGMTTTASMSVSAGVVNIGGAGLGGLLPGGIPGVTGATGGLPVTVSPSGVDLPQGAAAFGGASGISSGVGSMAGAFGLGGSSLSGRSAYDILAATIDARRTPLDPRRIYDYVPPGSDTTLDRTLSSFSATKVGGRFGDDYSSSMLSRVTQDTTAAVEKLRDASSSAASNVGGFGDVLSKALGNVASGNFNLGGVFGDSPLIPGNADGGLITGPGGPRSDNLLSWLSPGEYVINAASTSRHRPLLDAINSGQHLPRYAAGGFVPSPTGEFGESAGFGEVLH